MKSKVIENCRYVYEIFIEKIMEFTEFLRYAFKRTDGYRSSLVEIYKIKERYTDKEFVKEFLKERQKTVGPDRYRIEITTDYTPDIEEIIGEVILMRKNKVIEKAQLITKPNIPSAEKLIYWRF